MNHLSSTDAAFLHLETPETPMHVGSLMLFELPAGYKGDYFEEVKAMVAQRRHLGSIFNRKLARPDWNEIAVSCSRPSLTIA